MTIVTSRASRVVNHGFALKARNETSAPMLTYVADDSATFLAERPKLVVKFDDASNNPSGPTVEFKSILDADLVTGSNVDLGVEAGDDRRVEYYVDDVLVGSDTSAQWGVTSVPRGTPRRCRRRRTGRT